MRHRHFIWLIETNDLLLVQLIRSWRDKSKNQLHKVLPILSAGFFVAFHQHSLAGCFSVDSKTDIYSAATFKMKIGKLIPSYCQGGTTSYGVKFFNFLPMELATQKFEPKCVHSSSKSRGSCIWLLSVMMNADIASLVSVALGRFYHGFIRIFIYS